MDRVEIDQILRQLVAVDAPSGREAPAGAIVQDWCSRYADDVCVDALGNIIAVCHGQPRDESPTRRGRLMLAAHMDEIGLVVTGIDRGFLLVAAIGGIDPRSMVGQEVTVYPGGPASPAFPAGLTGYIGARPPHVIPVPERKNVIPLADLRVDLGLPSSDASPAAEAESEAAGWLDATPEGYALNDLVHIGDHVVVKGPAVDLLGGRIAAKAMDNRAGLAAAIAALGYLRGLQHSWDVYLIATVQEEVNLSGAVAGSYGLAPDIAVAVDVTFGETPGQEDRHTSELGKGPAIAWGPNLHPGVVERLRAAAEANEIPYSTEPLSGNSGSDAWAIQVARGGIPTGLLSIPTRYMHSATEIVVLADLDRTARLIAAFAAHLNMDSLARLPEEV